MGYMYMRLKKKGYNLASPTIHDKKSTAKKKAITWRNKGYNARVIRVAGNDYMVMKKKRKGR